MTDKLDKKAEKVSAPDTLVDALESIQNLLEKSDSKLAAAKESVALASTMPKLNQTHSAIDGNEQNASDPEQMEIPVLDDIVMPATASDTQLDDAIPTLYDIAENTHTPQILDYIDQLETQLSQTLSMSLKENLAQMESQLQSTLSTEIDKIRTKIKKDFL